MMNLWHEDDGKFPFALFIFWLFLVFGVPFIAFCGFYVSTFGDK